MNKLNKLKSVLTNHTYIADLEKVTGRNNNNRTVTFSKSTIEKMKKARIERIRRDMIGGYMNLLANFKG